MNIEVRFFARIKEALQTEKALIHLPKEVETVGQVRAFLVKRGGVWAEVLGEDQVLHMACNHKITGSNTKISEGCVIAFFPPVTGG